MGISTERRFMWALRLTDREKTELQRLADFNGLSKSAQVRYLIRREFESHKVLIDDRYKQA